MVKIKNTISNGLAHLAYAAVGRPVFRHLKWLRQTETWSPQQRQQWRLSRVARIVAFAWEHVPFYREFWSDHGLNKRPFRHFEELLDYPILSKDIFRENRKRLQPDNLRSIRHQAKHTGGTTGQPIHYLQDLEQWSLMQAFHLYGWGFTGYHLGDPVGIIAGGSLLPDRVTLKGRVRAWIERKIFLLGVHMDAVLAEKYHNALVRFKAEVLYGYPSIISVFSKHLAERGLSLPCLRAIITTGEMLHPQYRDIIETNLKCKVFDNLGCNDGGFESYECSHHDGFHYNDLQSFLEVQPSEDTSLGELLITNLWNKATPFIRYANGDLIRLAKEPCPCGSLFPLIASVEGRTADILTFADGRSLSGPALTLIFAEMDIDGWQIVKTSPCKIEVRIQSPESLPLKDASHILRVLSGHVGSDIAVSIVPVDRFDLTQAGKLKPIWDEAGESALRR